MNEEKLSVSVTEVADAKQENTVTKKYDTGKALPAPNPPDNSAEQKALAATQQLIALIKIGGKFWVFDRSTLNTHTDDGTLEKFQPSPLSHGRLLIKRYLKANYPKADAKQVIEEFWYSPDTVCYFGIEFNPAGTSENYLNLWKGPCIKPIHGQWPRIKSFLLKIICDGDQTAFDYLVRFIAHALQHPEEKPGIIIILIGGQGTGKGTFGRLLQGIWGGTFLQVYNVNAVTGTFNASLERSFIVFMDEALFSGDRRAANALKSIVTESSILINEKHQPARQIKSYHRLVAATNAEHFKHTERDDRRDFVLRVSETCKGNQAYWEALNHEMINGGIEAMAYDLMEMDLAGFNVRKKPNTSELLEQKLLSLDPIARWWQECLIQGVLDEKDEWWPDFVSTADAIDGIMDAAGGRIYRKPSPRDVVQEMKKLCPSAKSDQKQKFGNRSRGFTLPSLQQARNEFEAYIGAPIEWPPLSLEDRCAAAQLNDPRPESLQVDYQWQGEVTDDDDF